MELLIKALAAFFLPPLAVVLHRRFDVHLLINVLLWILLCHVGGVVHALYVILGTEDTGGLKLS